MRTVREAIETGKKTASFEFSAFESMLQRGISAHGLTFLAALKMAYWKEDRIGKIFRLSTPELTRENFLPNWNRDRYWRALQELLITGDLVKITNVQPRSEGRFAACRYRFGDLPSCIAQDDPDSIWHDPISQNGIGQFLN